MKYEIIVIGGGPAGIISAVTARKHYPNKKILLIKSVGKGVVPCGIPYMFKTLENPEDNLLGDAPLTSNKVEIKVDEVININKELKVIKTNNDSFEYEKLILAIGSNPIIPKIEGVEKKGVYSIYKEFNYLKNLKEKIFASKNIVIIGGGFIGVEFADELSKLNEVNIYLVELSADILSNSFDKEFAQLAHDFLSKQGVNIITGSKVEKINGDEEVNSVSLSNGNSIPADMVILGMGATPNSKLAEQAGVVVDKHKGIIVNEYMETSDPNIFAVGDCAEKKSFFTQDPVNIMLASIATAEARIAGLNLYKEDAKLKSKGTIASYSTEIGNLTLAAVGLTETAANKKGMNIMVGSVECPDKHPGKMPGVANIKLKLLFSKESEKLLGGQVAGGCSCGELINIIGLAIQKNTLLTELETLQVATHPKLTAAPTKYPIISAAQTVIFNRNK